MNRRMIGFYNYTVILTYLGMIAACMGIFMAIDGKPGLAIWCLMIAGLCDMFDGTVASTMQRTDDQKRFGIQIDSLCDLIAFGVLPGLFGYTVSDNKAVAGVVGVLISLAAVIRLAYFNVLEENRQKTETGHRKAYLGVPVTTIALVLPFIYILNINGILAGTLVYNIATAIVAIGFLTPVFIKKPQFTGKIIIMAIGILEAAAMVFFGNPA